MTTLRSLTRIAAAPDAPAQLPESTWVLVESEGRVYRVPVSAFMSSGISVHGTWQYIPSSATPGWGGFASGVGILPLDATTVYFNTNTRDGGNIAGIEALITAGWVIYCRAQDNANAWIKYAVTGPASLSVDVISVPVSRAAVGTEPGVGWVNVNVVFQGP
jgi:hypothetical protein